MMSERLTQFLFDRSRRYSLNLDAQFVVYGKLLREEMRDSVKLHAEEAKDHAKCICLHVPLK